MTTYEIGIKSSLLRLIEEEKKTVEIRLNRDKFQRFLPGDRLMFREDLWENGKIIKSSATNLRATITKIDHFASLKAMLKKVSLSLISPKETPEEFISTTLQFYPFENQQQSGFVAIHFKLDSSSLK